MLARLPASPSRAVRVGAGVEGRREGIGAREGGSGSGALPPCPISPNTASDPAEDCSGF